MRVYDKDCKTCANQKSCGLLQELRELLDNPTKINGTLRYSCGSAWTPIHSIGTRVRVMLKSLIEGGYNDWHNTEDGPDADFVPPIFKSIRAYGVVEALSNDRRFIIVRLDKTMKVRRRNRKDNPETDETAGYEEEVDRYICRPQKAVAVKVRK
jgi:hypothetical protein